MGEVPTCPACTLQHRPEVGCLAGVVLACGSRSYARWIRVCEILDQLALRMRINGVRHGNARGADSLAHRWALARNLPADPVPADWLRFGKGAGPIRNAAMLVRLPIPVVCVAFPPGPAGTFDMCARCSDVQIPVWRVDWTDQDREREVAWLARRAA